MTTALDRIRIRLAEAEACRAAVIGPCGALDQRLATWRDAMGEVLAAAPAPAPAPAAAPTIALPPLALRDDFPAFANRPNADDGAAAWNAYIAPRDRAASDAIGAIARTAEAFGEQVAELAADIEAAAEQPPAAPPQPVEAASALEAPAVAAMDDAPPSAPMPPPAEAPMPAPEAPRRIPADTATVIQQHQAFMDPDDLPDPPAMPKARDWPPHPVRTPERMAAFPALWLSRAPTTQVHAALSALPGEPMVRKGALYDMARDWGLPSSHIWTLAAATAPGPAAPQPLASRQRTPARMKLFRTLWMDARLTVRQIQARLNELPGEPIGKPASLYGWAKIAGLPTQRPQPDEAPEPLPELPAPPPPRAVHPPQPAAGGAEAAPFAVGAGGQSRQGAPVATAAQRAEAPQPPPPAPSLEEAAPPPPAETLTPAQRDAVRRLRGQAYSVESIARRTCIPLDVVQALDAQAEATAMDLLAIPADTDAIFLETGLTPRRIKALRGRAKQRAA